MANESSEAFVDRVVRALRSLFDSHKLRRKPMMTLDQFRDAAKAAVNAGIRAGVQYGVNNHAFISPNDGELPYKKIDPDNTHLLRLISDYQRVHIINTEIADIWKAETQAAWAGHRRRLLFTVLHGIAIGAVLLLTYAIADWLCIPMPMLPRLPTG